VHFFELGAVEAPFAEVPRAFQRQRVNAAIQPFRTEVAKGKGVVGADSVEIDAEHKPICGASHISASPG